jgi:pimeloyl-ACP methyl ester carboxylesterase
MPTSLTSEAAESEHGQTTYPATVRGLVTISRSRSEGSRHGARRTALLAVALLIATAVSGGSTRAAATAPPAPKLAVAGASVHGFAVRLPARRAGATNLCGEAPGLLCSQVVVPLDRTGVVPGTVSLHVEQLPAGGVARGTIFLIAGGPGQGSAHVFGLGNAGADQLYRYLFPGYNLVAYDDRGTGESGLIDCPALQAATTEAANRVAAEACGTSLGAAANFYSTAIHAEDLEAVRQSLGIDKVALYGVSYGTKLSIAYALAHPDHVARILLDSVLPPELPDPYEASVFRSMPATLAAYCAAGCNGAAFASDVIAVANKLAAKPLKGKALVSNGRSVAKTVDGQAVLSIVLDADLSPGEAAELPAVMHAARGGNTQPLLRLAFLHDVANEEPSIELSAGLYAATVCRDGPFPWDPNTPVDQRPAALQSAITALPAGTLGPFGSWAAGFGNADFCLRWPGPTGGVPFGAGPLPDVPMLAVSGAFDMRTPTEGAKSVVSRFPQGRLLVVPGVGHSTVTADPSGCALNGVRAWMLDQAVPGACPRVKPLVTPVSALPAPGRAHPSRRLSPRATYTIAKESVQDALALWLMTAGTSGGAASVPGVYGGRIVATGNGLALSGFSDARGVTISGGLTLKKLGPPLVFQGTVTVGGTAGAHGLLGLSGASLAGSLGGSTVR